MIIRYRRKACSKVARREEIVLCNFTLCISSPFHLTLCSVQCLPIYLSRIFTNLQAYKEKQSQEVTVKAFEKGTVGDGKDCTSKKKWYILAALLLLVVIIAAAVGGSMANKNSSSSGNAASSTGGSSTAADDADDFGTTTGTTGGGASTGGTTAGTTGGEADDFDGGVVVDPDAPCVPCTDIPTEFMLDDGVTCENFDNLQGRCGATGSWWFDDRDWDDDWV